MEEVNIPITLDDSGFSTGAKQVINRMEETQKEVDKTGMSVDEFAKRMQGVLSSFDRLTQAVDKNTASQEKAMSAGKKAADSEKQGADKATDAINKTGEATDSLGQKLKQTGDEGAAGFGKLQKAAAGFFTLAAAKEFGQKVFEVRKKMESLQVSLETLAGTDVGKQLYEDIRQVSPMIQAEFAKGAQTLLGFNTEAQKVMPILKQIGDISMGDSQKFNSLTLAFAQMSSTGKLMGQDLLQMINAGFNPLVVISEKTGKSVAELKDEMSKGAISVEMVEEAFRSATEEGGKFHGMLEAQSKALEGAYSNLQGAINGMFNSIGEQSEGIMAGSINAATLLVQNYETVGKVIMSLVGVYGVYKTALMINIALEKAQAVNRLASIKGVTAMEVATGLLTGKLKVLNAVLMANPYALAAAAVAALGAAIYAAASEASEMEEAQRRLDNQTKENEASVLNEMRNLDSLNRQLQECERGTEQYRKVKKSIIDQYGQYYSGLDAEIERVGNLSGVYDQLTEAIRRSIGARNLKSFYDKEMENYDKTVSDKLNKAYDVLQDKYGKDEGSRLYHEVFRKVSDKNYKISEKDMNKLGNAKFWGVRLGGDASDGLADFRISVGRLVREIDDTKEASDAALKKYKDMYEITDEQWNDVIYGGSKGNGTTPTTPTSPKGKGGKKGSAVDHTAEQEAQRRQRLFEIEQRERERQTKERATLAAAMADLEIASEADASRREQLQREKDHQASLDAIDRQVEEWKKANYEAAKEKWEAANKDKKTSFSDTEEGKAGWQGQQLTGVQDTTRRAMIQAENAKEAQAAKERAEALIASHQSYTDRKLAIDRQYSEDVKRIDAEIAAAEARGDNDTVSALQRSKRQAATDRAKKQASLSLDILKDSPEYIRAFEDLEQTSSETLEYLIEEFEKAKEAAAQSLDPKDLKEYTDTIQRMQDEINSRNPFKTLKKSMDDLRKSEKNVKDAKKRLDLVKQGVKVVKSYRKEGDKMVAVYYDEIEAQKEYNKSEDEYLKNRNKVKKAHKELQDEWSELGQQVQQLGDQIGGLGGECVSMIGDIMNFAVNISQTIDIVTATTAQGISAIEKASAILAIIQVAIQVVQAMASLLSGIFGDSDNGFAAAKEQYDNLSKVWDELIDKKRKYLSESWSNEAKQASKEAIELLKAEQAMNKIVAEARLGAGASAGSHSYGYRMWQGSYGYDGKNWQDVAGDISRELGVRFTGMSDMLNMSAEQLEWIKKNYTGLWANMDSEFQNALENIITFSTTEAEILEELKERITGSSISDIYENFMDSLYEIANGSEDVMDDIADNWQEMINRMVVNNVVGTRAKEELKSWYEELYNLQDRYNDHQMTDSAYQQELERLRNSYNSIVTSSQQEIENFRQMGIIKTLEETAEEAKKYFEDILESWKDTLTDLESTTDDWKNTLIDQIFSDLVESAILNAPVTMGEKTFDNFKKYLQDWTDRYKSLIEDTTLSDEERNERLKVLIDEQTTLREQQAEKAKQLAEGIGKDMSEAFSNSLDNLGESLIEGLLANSEADAENAGKQIALSMIKEMLQTMLASEKYAGRMEEIRKKWQQLLSGEDVSFTMDDVLQDIANLNNDIANDESISALAQQYKELNKQVENTQTVFNDLHNTFLNTLTDMKGDAESFRKTLEQTMLKDFIDKHVLDVPITVNGMDFEDFNAYVEDWNSRYAKEVKAGNMEAVDALLDELVQVRELTLSQAEDLRKRLEESMHELGSGFSNLRDTFVKTLTNIVGDAETLGKEIGQTMMEQMLNAFVEKQYSDRINAVNEEWAKALESGDPDKIDEIRQKVISLYETISSDRVVKQLADDIKALTDTGTPFDNLRSSYLSAVTDMKKSTKDFTQEISKMIAESFVDSFVLGGMFDDKIEEWKKKYRDITTDAGLSEEERMKQLRGLSEMIAAEREGMQGQVSEIYRLLGISDQQDQQATMSLAEAATYDQFELYLGIATAQQIALEQGNSVRQQILSTLQTMGQITSPTNPTLLEMRNMFSTANEYLLDIKLSNRKILDSFSVQLESINAKLRKL